MIQADHVVLVVADDVPVPTQFPHTDDVDVAEVMVLSPHQVTHTPLVGEVALVQLLT